MSVLLNAVYLLTLILLSPAIALRSWRTGKYRQGLSAKLWGNVELRLGHRHCVWLHAVSVGEVNLIGTIIAQLESARPDVDLYITTTTRTGFELARSKYARHIVSYCPMDFSWAVRRAIQRIRPNVLLLTELELWPNLIRRAARDGVAIGLVNARLSQRSFAGYRRIRWIIRPILNQLRWAAAQSEEYAARLIELGMTPKKIVITGSLKYDGVETDRENTRSRQLRRLVGIDAQTRIFLAGSTQAPEEEMALAVYQKLSLHEPHLRLIIVPRHPERFNEVANLLNRSSVDWSRRSQLVPGQPVERVLLVDTVGELAAWWGTADIAFVGGSMGNRGGQNMIEPAAYGAAVCFGPHTENFRQVVQQLIEHRAAIIVHNQSDLERFLKACLSDREMAKQQGQRARDLVLSNRGAMTKTVALIHALLPASTNKPSHNAQGESRRRSSNSVLRSRKSA